MKEVELTTESYGRFLRSRCPDLKWFMACDEPTQEALAAVGDEYMSSQAVTLALIFQDPELASSVQGTLAGDPDAEVAYLQSAIANVITGMKEGRESRGVEAPQEPAERPPEPSELDGAQGGGTFERVGRAPGGSFIR